MGDERRPAHYTQRGMATGGVGAMEMRGGNYDDQGKKVDDVKPDAAPANASNYNDSGFSPTGNPNWVPTGPPYDYFKASSDNGDYGNGGKRKQGKGIQRID